MDYLLPVLAGLTLGCIHAFDVDHITAVAAFTSKNPRPLQAARFGIIWGFGHTTTLVLLGLLSIVFRFVIPPYIESTAEAMVGLLLIAIGIWILKDTFRRRRLHIHKHSHGGVEHVHLHSHANATHHHHGHSMFLVGATHGFAGTASVMVVIPIAISQSILFSALYLILFGIGTMLAMGLFGYLVGSIASKTGGARRLTIMQGIAGSASLLIGLVWLAETLSELTWL